MGLFELTDPAHGRPGGPTVHELIERGERYADRLADQPLVQARMLDVIGRVYYRLGDYERSVVLLRQALAIRRGRLGEEHVDVAASLANLARALHDHDDHDEADALYQEALARRQRLLGHDAIETAESVEAYAIFLLRVKSDAQTRGSDAARGAGPPARIGIGIWIGSGARRGGFAGARGASARARGRA